MSPQSLGASPGTKRLATPVDRTVKRMEALRTQNDNLRWEVQRLDVENHRLRENNPEASRSLDREAQLERAKCDIDELTDHVQASEGRVAEYTETVERAERRAADAEDRVTEVEQQLTDQ